MEHREIKETIVRGLKDSIHPSILSCKGTYRPDDLGICLQSSISNNEIVVSRNLSKSIKLFVESVLSNDLDNQLKETNSHSKETWKIDAHNLSKVLADDTRVLCIQDNINNILDSCMKEVINDPMKNISDSDLDISPLLQPEHIIEVAECISPEKPLDVKLNALRILLKSHLTEVVTAEGWLILQKNLVENLCDNNNDIFTTCLKIHAKLASSSSSLAVKECALNLLESLSKYYYLQYSESKVTLFQSVHFYRVVHLTRLLFDVLKEATINVARFGENKLDEMIENLIQLISIHVPQKQSRNKILLSPLEVFSYLDPYCNWLTNLTHFALTRRLFFSSLSKNISFLKVIIEEILNWVTEPVIPSKNSIKVLTGELNVPVHKFSSFCHSLAVFSIVCSFGSGSSFFPLTIRKEEPLSIEDILKMLISIIDDKKFHESLYTKSTERFKVFFAQKISKLLCSKEVKGSDLLLKLMAANENQMTSSNPIKIKIIESVSYYNYPQNPLLGNDVSLKRKNSLFQRCILINSSYTNQSMGSIRSKRGIEHQNSTNLPVNVETKDLKPFEVYLQNVTDKIKTADIKENHCLIQTITTVFKNFDELLEVSNTLKIKTTQVVAETYLTLQEYIKNPDSTFSNRANFLNLSENCVHLLIQGAILPLGFHILKEFHVVAPLLVDQLQHPLINWNDSVWLKFLSSSTMTNEGCKILSAESNGLIRKELNKLWIVIEEDCSGSELPIKHITKHLLKIISVLTFSLGGLKAMFIEPKEGSDITLTDEHDIRPSNLFMLLYYFALDTVNCPDFIHHQFALTVLAVITSNIDCSLYLQNRLKYSEFLLQLQAENRVDESSEVIIDECSLLRHRIIERDYIPGRLRTDTKPSHVTPRPESTLAQAKSRSRGTGELARWLSETRLGLHDLSWLKHTRKLYKNSNLDDMKPSTILDLLEQVVKVFPESKTVKWNHGLGESILLAEEQLAVQLVMRYGAHHRLIQMTPQNVENLTQLLLLAKNSLNNTADTFEGLDWFVASAFLLCSGNIEKTQSFLSLVSGLPSAPLIWLSLADPAILAQMGSVLETIIAEEMPVLCQLLQKAGLSWWYLCRVWISQCWWNVLDWPQICQWFTLAILYQSDHLIYFCVALLYFNYDRFLQLCQNDSAYEILINPVEKLHLHDVRIFIEKLHKKYHNMAQSNCLILTS